MQPCLDKAAASERPFPPAVRWRGQADYGLTGLVVIA